jgi:hypothetical protein
MTVGSIQRGHPGKRTKKITSWRSGVPPRGKSSESKINKYQVETTAAIIQAALVEFSVTR